MGEGITGCAGHNPWRRGWLGALGGVWGSSRQVCKAQPRRKGGSRAVGLAGEAACGARRCMPCPADQRPRLRCHPALSRRDSGVHRPAAADQRDSPAAADQCDIPAAADQRDSPAAADQRDSPAPADQRDIATARLPCSSRRATFPQRSRLSTPWCGQLQCSMLHAKNQRLQKRQPAPGAELP